jgi:hypothetical protein
VIVDGTSVAATRTRVLVALGAVLIVSAGSGSLLLARGGQSPAGDSSPFPVGEVFVGNEWSRVATSLTAHGYDAAAARVVSGLRLNFHNEPFALIRATSPSRGVCFLPVRGARLGPASCSAEGQLKTPLLAFGAFEESDGQKMTSVVGVARHAVTSVSMVDPRGYVAGLSMMPMAGGLTAFTGGYGVGKLVVRARVASGRIVAQTAIP